VCFIPGKTVTVPMSFTHRIAKTAPLLTQTGKRLTGDLVLSPRFFTNTLSRPRKKMLTRPPSQPHRSRIKFPEQMKID